ncbi:hypothetical protein ABTX81_05505 [Kitasatospora sp. NPDC097605]
MHYPTCGKAEAPDIASVCATRETCRPLADKVLAYWFPFGR